jgi:hypothetical protein
MKSLSGSMYCLLFEILEKRSPQLLPLLERAKMGTLESTEVASLCQIVTDEFCETGLLSDSEPNERGLLLEVLIDTLREAESKDGTKKF